MRTGPASQIPKYRLHKARGLAVVTLNGQDLYLGQHDSKESRLEYERVVAEWLANGRQLPHRSQAHSATITELIAAFWIYAQSVYPKNTQATFKAALRPLRRLYGHVPIREFQPKGLRTIQQSLASELADDGSHKFCRNTINDYSARIRMVFKWGVAEGLVPAEIWHGLTAVSGLRRGRTTARETEPIAPVLDEVVNKTIPHLPSIVADIVRVQRLTGMRPGEVCAMTWAEIDTSGDVWIYRPRDHKTAHHGIARVIPLGPQAQAVLGNQPEIDLSSPVFKPDLRRAHKGKRVAAPGYRADSYRRAIQRACERAGVAVWKPNQLRHTRATEVRREFGLDAAGALLGHTKLETTQIYAERSSELAIQLARSTG